MRILFVLFIIVPIAEMWVLIKVGEQIGATMTIMAVLLTAMIGVTLLRQQGLSTLFRANQRLEQGQIPAKEIFDGICLAVGGALLLTPGFLTDAFGFFCLVPYSRSLLVRYLLQHSNLQMSTSSFSVHPDPRESSNSPAGTIEGEYKREE
jgi:UPF0716 protein FxsA